MIRQSINFPALEQAELIQEEIKEKLGNNEVEGRTLVSLVSPGTELNANFRGKNFPNRSGYACVFEIERVGKDVTEFKQGDRVFCQGNHSSLQRHDKKNITLIDKKLDPETAVLARLAMVSTTTLMKTQTSSGDKAWIAGFGPVGYLAAAQFRNAGYEVSVIEIDDARRAIAEQEGYSTYRSCPVDDENMKKTVDIYVDCSGHEASVLAGCKMVRREGEVIMVGVPWQKRTEIDAHALLWEVFHNYVHLKSGWEWSLPYQADLNSPQSITRNTEKCLTWLKKESFVNKDLIGIYDPKNCQEVYNGLASQSLKDVFVVFDWTLLEKQQ